MSSVEAGSDGWTEAGWLAGIRRALVASMNTASCSLAALFSAASVVALSVGLSAGCTAPGQSSSGADAGGGGGANGEAGTGDAALTCSALFDCASKCPASNDTTCEDACVARGSTQAKDSVASLVACVQQNACGDDSACIQSNCQKEVQDCTSSGATVDGSAPAGQVPTDLVGRWQDSETIVDFRADGTVSYFLQWSGCSTLDTGTAVATATEVTLYFTAGVYKCAWAFAPKTRTFTYYFSSGATAGLHLKETNCGTDCWSDANLDKQ